MNLANQLSYDSEIYIRDRIFWLDLAYEHHKGNKVIPPQTKEKK
jgi:hypothetical protein